MKQKPEQCILKNFSRHEQAEGAAVHVGGEDAQV
jgi:hypothetical protein